VQQEPDGSYTIGLTGWNRNDYSALENYSRIAKLSMANADVTDQTLQYIRHCQELRELDLSRTQVTDEGLAALAALPKLEVLAMRGTRVTDAGFKQHLEALPALMVIDFRDTGVSLETQRQWKKAMKGRKFLKE
jgi:Leucine-rich repeat (LRR) protein